MVEPVLGAGDTVRAQVTLHNTGDRPALETVQVYVRDTVTTVTWAEKELKTYRQVVVEPGARVTVGLQLPGRGLHDRRRRRPPHRRARPVRAAGRPVVARRGAAARGLRRHGLTVTLDATRATYDAVAEDYARLVTGLDAEGPLDRAMLADFADRVDGPVADVGCGTGRMTAYLDGLGIDVVGIDLSPGMVDGRAADVPVPALRGR